MSGAPGAQPVGGERAELSAQRRGWVDIPATAVEIHPNAALIILHHPEAGPLQVSIETEGLIGLHDNLTRVMYKTDTAGGSAGAPRFNSNWELVAIHHSRSGVGCEGIPLAAIVNLLDQRGKKHVLQIALL